MPIPILAGAARIGSFLISNKAAKSSAFLGEGLKTSKKLSTEILGYDFISLLLKMVVFYGFAMGIEKLHNIIIGTPSFFLDVLRFFGAGIPKTEPDFFTKLFSAEGYNGIKYWTAINFAVMGLVIIEGIMYINANRQMGANPSPFALATFTMILFLLSAFSLPGLIEKFKNKFSEQTKAANQ